MRVDENLHRRGRRVRKSILGAENSARAAKGRTPFNADFQDLTLQYVWAQVWGRPGLSIRDRSMLTIAMLVAMGKPDVLKTHIKATRNTGVTRTEVKEILMHATIYAGLPSGYRAFQVAAETYAEMDQEKVAARPARPKKRIAKKPKKR